MVPLKQWGFCARGDFKIGGERNSVMQSEVQEDKGGFEEVIALMGNQSDYDKDEMVLV